MSIFEDIKSRLSELQDEKYREMQIKIIPNVDPESIIGVRTPALRSLAKELAKRDDVDVFLDDLPHVFFEENQLHAFILSGMKDYEACIQRLHRFLPYVDNWATCDQMSPKVFKKHRPELLEQIKDWIASDEPYTIRFGVGMLMEHYLDDAFDPRFPARYRFFHIRNLYIYFPSLNQLLFHQPEVLPLLRTIPVPRPLPETSPLQQERVLKAPLRFLKDPALPDRKYVPLLSLRPKEGQDPARSLPLKDAFPRPARL